MITCYTMFNPMIINLLYNLVLIKTSVFSNSHEVLVLECRIKQVDLVFNSAIKKDEHTIVILLVSFFINVYMLIKSQDFITAFEKIIVQLFTDIFEVFSIHLFEEVKLVDFFLDSFEVALFVVTAFL